jgi:type IX secretion system substrate protein
MKMNFLNSTKAGILLLAATLGSNFASGTVFTAAASGGTWSVGTTWVGGIAPPFKLGTLDQVSIGGGITVTMDSTVELTAAALVTVDGTLNSANNSFIMLLGMLSGTGAMTMQNVTMETGSVLNFTGALNTDTLINYEATLSTSAQMMVSKVLTYSGAMTIITGGSLTMGTGSVINVLGGSLTVTGGTLGLTSTYSVNYISTSITSGLEISGSGLSTITVNVLAANSVTLASSIILSDSLNVVSGALILNGHKVVVNGAITGAGTISGDSKANLAINTASGLISTISFTSGSRVLNSLTENVGPGKLVNLLSDLVLDSTLTLSGASNLNMNGVMLTLNGGFNGNGLIFVNTKSAIVINGAASILPDISIDGNLGSFVLNVGTGNTVTLGYDLTADTISLQTGTLVLNFHNLSVNGDISALGTGVVFATAGSNISVAASSSTSDSLTFTYPGNTVGNFTVNIGAAGSVMIGSDLIIHGELNLINGHINTGTNNLQIATSGSIVGANSNSYVITAPGGYLTMNAAVSVIDTFPIGTVSSYSPASIMLNTGSSVGTVGVNASTGVYSLGTSGTLLSATQPMVNTTWLFETSIASGLNANMQLTWSPATEVNGFIHTGDYISHYISGAWDKSSDSLNATNVTGGMFSIERLAVTSMSPFAVFNRNAITGIDEVVVGKAFNVYPNPVSGNLYIQNNTGTTGVTHADVLNILGQVVGTYTLTNTMTIVPMEGLTTGDYFIRLYNDKMTVVEKVVKL